MPRPANCPSEAGRGPPYRFEPVLTSPRDPGRITARLRQRALVRGWTMKRPRSRFVSYLVYVAVRLVVAVAQALTIRQSYAFADWLAGLLYRVDRRHRQVALENLLHAFGDRYTDA